MERVFDIAVNLSQKSNKKIKGIELIEYKGELYYCFSFNGFSYDKFEDLTFVNVKTGMLENISENSQCFILAVIEVPMLD